MPDHVLDYFELPTTSTAKSSAFFRKAFGWSFVDFGSDYTEVRDAGLLWGLNADAGDHSAAPVPVIRTSDIVRAARDVAAAGGIITRQTYDYPGGQRFFFREPGGSECAVYMTKE